MQTSEQLRKERDGARRTMVAEAHNVDQELENLDGGATRNNCIADFKKLVEGDSTITIRYKSAQEKYGEEAISARDIVKYLMNDKNGVVSKENIFEAIDSLIKKARHTMVVNMNIKELLRKNRGIRATFRAAQTSPYGEEVTVKNICQYVEDKKNSVANEDNVLEAINSLRAEAMNKMQAAIQARFNLPDSQSKEEPSQFRLTIIKPDGANSAAVNTRNVKCGCCSIF